MRLPSPSVSNFLWILIPIPLTLSLVLLSSNYYMIISWSIFSMNSTNISFPIILDPWGCLFSTTVLFISANVMKFSISYMSTEKFMQRFSTLVLLFVLSMNLLIFIPNMMCLLLGWDGLGIVSFILVVYYQNPKSLAAGMITALMNRVGDVMILLAIALMLNFGHWSIMSMWNDKSLPLLGILIMIAASTKSAQIPFSSWLPAAMAAPTPVSALVHSSTLVTAGVFLLFRFHYILDPIPFYKESLLIISSITMLMAGTAATTECDMKKVIALSTLSQLGVMMSSLGLNLPLLAFFHLMTHALFKALLFLAAGSMISYHSHSQDLRFMGNLILSSPLTTSSILIANLALCGSPFFAGFYSKDLILEMSLFNPTNIIILFLFFSATALTASYTIRFLISVIWNSSNSLPFQYSRDNDNNFTSPIMILSFSAIIMGAGFNWSTFNFLPEPSLPLYLKLFPLMITILGAILAYSITSNLNAFSLTKMKSHHFISSMWFLQPTTSQGLIFLPLKSSHTALKSIDSGWMEMLSNQGIFKILNKSSNFQSSLSKNMTTTTLSLMILSMLFLSI